MPVLKTVKRSSAGLFRFDENLIFNTYDSYTFFAKFVIFTFNICDFSIKLNSTLNEPNLYFISALSRIESTQTGRDSTPRIYADANHDEIDSCYFTASPVNMHNPANSFSGSAKYVNCVCTLKLS